MFTKVRKWLIALLATVAIAVAAVCAVSIIPESRKTVYAAETETNIIYWGRSGGILEISWQPVSGRNKTGSFAYNEVFSDGKQQWLADMGQPSVAPITSVSITGVSPVSTAYWFSGCSKLTSVTFGDGFSSANVIYMNNMFDGCSSLTTLDLSKFNVSDQTDVSNILSGCTSLEKLTVSGTLAARLAGSDNSGLYDDGSKWYKDGVEFSNDNRFTAAGTYYTTKQIYWGVDGNKLTISDTEQTSAAKGNFDFNTRFTIGNAPWTTYSNSITQAEVTGSVTPESTEYWFYSCSSLVSLDLSGLDASGLTRMGYMFQGCDGLKSITVNDSLAQELAGTLNNTYLYNGNHSVWYGQNRQYTDSDRFNAAGTYTTTQKIYWSLSEGTLTINGTGIADTPEQSGSFDYDYTGGVQWADYAASVTAVSITGVAPVSTANWFNGFTGLTEIDLSGLNTSNVSDTSGMFYGCSGLTSLGLTSFNISGVTDMSGMFHGCSGLTSLDLSKWNAASVTNVDGMLYGCDSLNTLMVSDSLASALYGANDKSAFELSDGTHRTWYGKDNSYTYEAPFGKGGDYTTTVHIYWYISGNKLTISSSVAGTPAQSGSFAFSAKFDTAPWYESSSAVTTVEVTEIAPESTANWFSGLNKLESVTFGSGFIASNIIQTTNMFSGCDALASLTVSDAMAVKLAESADSGLYEGNHATWYGEYQPHTVDEPFTAGGTYITKQRIYWNVENDTLTLNVTGTTATATARGSFVCDEASFQTSEDVPWAEYAASITAVEIEDVAPVSTAYWFFGFSSLSSLDLSGFDTTNVTDMHGMFSGCGKLTSLDLSGFDTANVTDMNNMFYGCNSLTELNLPATFTTANVTNMEYIFAFCSGLTSLDLSGLDAVNVTGADSMLYGCSALNAIRLSDSLAQKLAGTDSGLYDGKTWYDNDGPAYTADNHLTKGGEYTTVKPAFEVSADGAATTYHDTIDKAWARANFVASATITMSEAATTPSALEVAAGKNITLVSNGYDLITAGVNVSGTLTVGGGKIDGEIYVVSGGLLKIAGAPQITVDTEAIHAVAVTAELTDGAQIVVKSTGAIVTGYTQDGDPSQYIKAADPETNDCTSVKDGVVTLGTHAVGGITVTVVNNKTYKAFDRFDSTTVVVKTYCAHCGDELDTVSYGENGYGVAYQTRSELHVGDEYLTVNYRGYGGKVAVTVVPVDVDLDWQYSADTVHNWGEIPAKLVYNARGEGLRANFRAYFTDPNGTEYAFGMQNEAYALIAVDGETFTYTGAIKNARTYTLKLNTSAETLKDFNFGNNLATVTISPFEIELGDENNFHWFLPEYGSELRDGYIETLTGDDGAVIYKYHSEQGGNYTKVVRSVVRDRGREVTVALYGLRGTQNNPDGIIVYEIEYVEDGDYTAVQSAIGKYTAKAVLKFTQAAGGNYVFVNKIPFAANRHMTATANGDGTYTVTKEWYIAQIDNGLLSQNGETYGQEWSVSGWAFGEDIERFAPRLEHGDAGEYMGTYTFAQDDNRVMFTLYRNTTNTQGQIVKTQIGSPFNRYDFAKFLNKTMPAGVYELRATVAAIDAEAGHTHWYDGTEHTDANLHYAAFTRTFTFEVTNGEISSNLNDGLKGKTFNYVYDGTLKLYGDSFTLAVLIPERGDAADNEWAKAEYDGYYASGDIELKYRLSRWGGAPEYQSAQQLENRGPGQSPVNADTYVVYYRLSLLNYNYFGEAEDYFTVVIAKAGVAKPADIDGGTYDGTEKTANVTETERYTVESSLSFINAGRHEITLRLKDTANYAWVEDDGLSDSPETTIIFEIKRIGVEKPANQEHTYDGTEFAYTVATGVGYTVTGTYKFVNANEDGHDITLTLNDAQNYAWLEDGGLSEGATTTVKLFIKKADYYNSLEGVTFEGATFTYDGTAHEISIVGQLPQGVYVSYIDNGQLNAGEYTVTAQFLLDETLSVNYNNLMTPKQATLKINKAKVTVPQDITQTLTDGSYTYGTDSELYEVVGDSTFTEAGTYEITLKLKDADNYEWENVDGGQIKITLTLNAAPSGGQSGKSNMIWLIVGVAGGVLVVGIVVIAVVIKKRKNKR